MNIKASSFILPAVLLLLVYCGCGLETYQQIPVLGAPLGVTATNYAAGLIRVQFWGENDETFFSGYYIYMALNPNDLLIGNGMPVLNTDGRAGKPTIYNISPMTSAQQFSFDITSYTNNSSLSIGTTYFFDVKAYSGEYNIFSYSSGITNCTLSN
jgi:hypothetical protein